MLKILKAIIGKQTSNPIAPREPRKPSEEQLNHYWAEIDLAKARNQTYPTDPQDMVPVPERALFRDGEYFGHPLNSFGVSLEEIVPFLDVHRDQSLWFSVVAGLNYDISLTFEVIEWILAQPDCDALVAVKAFQYLAGPYFCGEPSDDPYAVKANALRPLSVIVEREQAGIDYVVGLAYDNRSMDGVTGKRLLEEARRAKSKLTEDQQSILEIPEKTLLAGGGGAKPIEKYSVDEDGILALSKSQAAILH
ncbi:DUF4274 domain-containing protein [Ruegeria sediminis]|uniref:DUF4274 domain-containing protein n=1 Tax=Ruegeria sediminis TaxID=2583820 RepID=A0ABY2WS00_9RHOB|nr:DUF4274 domain-containing protein [Ruegeria sediminis]TMV02566.1 DUF4274 domain-containing protein [Ruegeria sediminis]